MSGKAKSAGILCVFRAFSTQPGANRSLLRCRIPVRARPWPLFSGNREKKAYARKEICRGDRKSPRHPHASDLKSTMSLSPQVGGRGVFIAIQIHRNPKQKHRRPTSFAARRMNAFLTGCPIAHAPNSRGTGASVSPVPGSTRRRKGRTSGGSGVSPDRFFPPVPVDTGNGAAGGHPVPRGA